MIDSLLRYILR